VTGRAAVADVDQAADRVTLRDIAVTNVRWPNMTPEFEPRLKDIENSTYERALDTPLAVVRDKQSRACYLTSGKLWYTAKDPLGPWQPTSSPPADLVKNMPRTTRRSRRRRRRPSSSWRPSRPR
jgi:hypothetical protein